MTHMLKVSSVTEGLKTDFMGRNCYSFEELESTNDRAFELAGSGAIEGTIVIAESQSSGRGRQGRAWISPGGVNIYASLVLRPSILPKRASQITLVAAVALAETLSLYLEGTGSMARIKWPNDIMVGGKKCAGILSEMKMKGREIDFMIVGIGINVNLKGSDIPCELSDIATSLYMERGGKVCDRARMINKICENMERWYKLYLARGFAEVKSAWNSYSDINGRQVKAASGSTDGSFLESYEEGLAMGINDAGALLLEKNDGTIVEIYAGDIIL